ncbi:Peroxidase 15 [Zea mays]|uniref:Peroxidase n=2 Tax=Zea mays TaxID=4577 RepID=A0A1D6KAW3_MAIZE|nr:Peroxidase 15 precursor [Zea mays]ONM00550.1 Peroxidase 54 [Zea mays]PWZ57988.1 Peroxidase 15 [Zea mays]
MVSSSSSPSATAAAVVLAVALMTTTCFHGATAQLCEDYYDSTCPDAYDIVKQVLVDAVQSDTRIFASLIRLHFHDCFVQGCDASLLLDSVPGMPSEKTSAPNNGSARGFGVVDAAKAALESACPGVVSCADILAIAAEISVELSGGPSWGVLLGRLDSKTSDFNGSLDLPEPTDNLTILQQKFSNLSLNDVDLVALSGGHTFGRVQCKFITDRLYNFSGTNMPDPTLDASYRAFLTQRCPRNGDPTALNDLDPTTPDTFDNNYYTNIEVNRGILNSDQELKSSPLAQGTTAPIVDQFAASQDDFFASFAQSMINMGNIKPLTDPSRGEVRTNCRRVN